uniref:Helicase C-terminal domain-containing protein n=1 Tax=Globodera pallida TaxID=36090 RepID=A0A183CR82_GLOPA
TASAGKDEVRIVGDGNSRGRRRATGSRERKLVARKLAENIEQFACIGDRGPVADVIRAFKPVVLSSRVQSVLVIVGRDSLANGETIEAMFEQLKLLAGLCKRFRHVKTFWCIPPFVNVKRSKFEALVEKMRAIEEPPAISMVATQSTGRSALEIFDLAIATTDIRSRRMGPTRTRDAER